MAKHSQNALSGSSRSLQAMQLEALLPQCIQVATHWMDAMADAAGLPSVLASLSNLLGGPKIGIMQYNLADGSSKVLNTANSAKSLSPIFERSLFAGGKTVSSIKSGQILQSDPSQDLTGNSRTQTRNQAEPFAIVLAVSGIRIETLEIKFRHPVQAEDYIIINALAEHFASSWVSASTSPNKENRSRHAKTIVAVAILGPQNSFGLSRSELRVCKRVGQGKSPKQIAAELGVSISTIRSHLKNIYAKTETSGQRSLQHRLHNPTMEEHA